MISQELNIAIRNTLATLVTHAEELGDLDAALGDGDLGITISLGSKAVIASLESLSAEATPAEVIQACATSFAEANPSTFAALISGGLLAGARVFVGKSAITMLDAANFIKAVADSISTRGRSVAGDKTVLDAILPARDALAANLNSESALDSAIDAAEQAVNETKMMQSKRGRAAWLQERSIGLQDPGATAFLYFLKSWKASN
jgi:dihydroxyacetone kinase-like protein